MDVTSMPHTWRRPAPLSTPGRTVPADDRSPLFVELSQEKLRMEPGQMCGFNQTRECFLGFHIIAGDFSFASFQDWLATLTPTSGAGMWMAPFRGLPASQVQTPLDLLYLDVQCRVLEAVEFFPTCRVSPGTPPAASVLALPAHSIFTSRTQAGDQIILCSGDEMEWRLERLARAETVVAAGLPATAGLAPGPVLGPVLVREEPKTAARPALIHELPVRIADAARIDPVRTEPARIEALPVDPAQPSPVGADRVRIPESPIAAATSAFTKTAAQTPDVALQPRPAQQQQPPAAQPPQPSKPWLDPSRQPTLSPLAKLGRWLLSDPADPRRTSRKPIPGLVAHFFTGGAPHPHEVRDVSATGLYVVTTERWYPGTVIRMTLTKPDLDLSPGERSVTVQARSVRWGNDGVGLEFVVSAPSKGRRGQESAFSPIDGEQLDRFLKRLGARPN